MHFAFHLLAALLAVAPDPASANGCEQYTTFYVAKKCEQNSCYGATPDQGAFDDNKQAFITWANQHTKACSGFCDSIYTSDKKFQGSFTMKCGVARLLKGSPNPPDATRNLTRHEDNRCGDVNCTPSHKAKQNCNFNIYGCEKN
ncbi:hypothetical protein FKW77_008034 [Venturia effusa]|uniref:Secreted protein n=1 Tax=Venturia effusa TaxID=50376 RepID=A0A517KZV5_9PEZI|nr:hypothetical protein FKW77_008034 [Venturia effusa]